MRQAFDILVVGAGPAGISAAVSAAEAGRHVGLVDDNPASGGQIWRSGAHLPSAAHRWLERLDRSTVVRLQRWTVFGCPEPTVLCAGRNAGAGTRGSLNGADGEEEYAELHYDRLILATGARERFLPFSGWTLPNVMGAGGLDALVRGGLPIAGKKVVVAGTGPLLLAVAAHLAASGARIAEICEQAPRRQMAHLATSLLTQPGKLWQGARYRWITRQAEYLTSCWPVAAHGDRKVRSVTLRQGRKQWTVDCDYLACGFHLVPNTELPALMGCGIENGFVATDDLLQTSVPGVWCAGEPNGIGGVELSLLEGRIAGLAAAGKLEQASALVRRRHRGVRFARALHRACALDPQLRELAAGDTLVCRCEDVRMEVLRHHSGWRDAKLHTRCGMGPCQGRICGPALEFLFGWRPDSVRPPLFPVLVSSLAAAPAPSKLPKETP